MDEETARKIRKLLEGQRQINEGISSGRYWIPEESPFDRGKDFAARLFGISVARTYIIDARNH